MEKIKKRPKPPLLGVVYGEFAFWIVILGMTIGIIGTIWHLSGGAHIMDPKDLLSRIWKGETPREIWEVTRGCKITYEHWDVHKLTFSDGLASFGVGTCCLAAVFGIWGTAISMVFRSKARDKETRGLFLMFVLTEGIILLLSAIGAILFQ
jgi:hypothetical protein